jgi:hypothetical protein
MGRQDAVHYCALLMYAMSEPLDTLMAHSAASSCAHRDQAWSWHPKGCAKPLQALAAFLVCMRP